MPSLSEVLKLKGVSTRNLEVKGSCVKSTIWIESDNQNANLQDVPLCAAQISFFPFINSPMGIVRTCPFNLNQGVFECIADGFPNRRGI